MTAMDPCIRLADRIEAVLDRGVAVSRNDCHFIGSTFGCASIREIGAVVRGGGDCEGDVLLDLLFSPDEAFQMEIEDLLIDHAFQKEDETKIAAHLARRHLAPPFDFSGYDHPLKIKMPAFCAHRLVARLKIWKPLDRHLSVAIGRSMARDRQKQVMVRLRNSRFQQTRNRVDFLCRLMERRGAGTRDFWTYFDFSLAFLDELSSDGDIYAALIDKKKGFFRHLQSATKYAAELRRSNMETMMLKGVQRPGVNREDLRRRMRTLDDLCRTCFGCSAYFEPTGDVLSCNKLETNDIQSISDLLS